MTNNQTPHQPLGTGLHFSAISPLHARLLFRCLTTIDTYQGMYHLFFAPVDVNEVRPSAQATEFAHAVINTMLVDGIIPTGWGHTVVSALRRLQHLRATEPGYLDMALEDVHPDELECLIKSIEFYTRTEDKYDD